MRLVESTRVMSTDEYRDLLYSLSRFPAILSIKLSNLGVWYLPLAIDSITAPASGAISTDLCFSTNITVG